MQEVSLVYSFEGEEERQYRAFLQTPAQDDAHQRVGEFVRELPYCAGHTLCRVKNLPDDVVEAHFTNRGADIDTPQRKKVVVWYLLPSTASQGVS